MGKREHPWIAIMLGITAAVLAAAVLLMHSEGTTADDGLMDYSSGWYYFEDGERREINLPCTVTYSGGESGEGLTIFHDANDTLESGMILSMSGAEHAPTICVDDTVIYHYDDAGFPRNQQMMAKVYCQGILTGDLSEETLSIAFQEAEDGVYSIAAVVVGTQEAVLGQYVYNDALNLGIVVLMWFLGGAALAAFFYMKYCGQSDRRFVHAAAFLLLCGGWCLTDAALFGYLLDYNPLVYYISFYFFMLFPLPLIHFLEETGELRKYRRFGVIEAAFIVNVIIQSALHLLLHIEFVRMLFVTHILLFGGVLALADAIRRDYRRTKSPELQTIGYAFFALGAGGVLSLLLYWGWKIYYYESVFEIGLAVFILILLAGLIRNVTENMRYRMEMGIYQRLAREDQMTGLRNRRAFEEFLADFQMKTADYREAVLVFFDVNGLKVVNDTMGHAAGDEMILMAAKSIENTFAPMGDCYRIGGDEFAAILLHPTGEPAEWYRVLDEQIRLRRGGTRIPLSIARGESCLTNPDGALKSISEWKSEADARMYRDKTRQKSLAEDSKGGTA